MVTTILNEEINAIAQPIIREVCWEASLSYGDELCLEVGEKILSFRI